MGIFYNEDGFTLIEIIIGILILSLVVIPVTGFFSNSINMVHKTRIKSQAIQIASNIIEEYKNKAAKDWSNISTDEEINYNISNNFDLLTNYIVDINIDYFNGNNNIKQMDVTIVWNNNNSVEMSTLIRKR